jgi:hypothetical protein
VTAVHVRGENGVQMYFDMPALPDAIAQRIARGDLARVNADGTPWEGDATAEAADDDPPADAPPLPSAKDNRQVWAASAISQGMDRDEANNLTKAQLIARLTGPPAAP